MFLKKDQKLEQNKQEVFLIDRPEVLDHLLNHLKIKTGSKLKVAIEQECLADAEVLSINENKVIVSIKNRIPAIHQPFTLLVASSRPPTMKKILEHGTTLGVKKFIFFPASLSQKSYLESKIYEEKTIEDLLILGVEQSGVFSKIPEFHKADHLSKALEYARGEKILLSLNEDHPAQALNQAFNKDKFSTPNKELTLAVGPERGWTTEEEQIILENGFISKKISKSILRVEIATFIALGQLQDCF